ncbi:ferric-dicitrate binding protein FerR (iron transport regulator) [Plantactinospora soyae]|uniref:Ferric-dicitrate binding protein FerR (Iron transport regulator) n=1 Tax=Plantactinospora soyae TaxID=1544732 RepID=A0A927M0N1_9ACTN|nr:ferric-dicitrate binding protein FerR (iron transport regulator) [Plantactinospora soyae]
MRHARKVKPRHRRAWWRLWRYCRCLTPYAPPEPSRTRATNQRPIWNAPAHPHLANSRAGAHTPAQEHRVRHGSRV